MEGEGLPRDPILEADIGKWIEIMVTGEKEKRYVDNFNLIFD